MMFAVLAFAVQLAAVANPGPGTVRADSLWSQSLGTRKQYVVYLPPSYETQRDRRYPVAFYLHGLGGDETNWTKLGHLAAAMDSLVAAGGPEMIIVMPDGDDGWYTTWNSLGNYASCRRQPPRDEPAERYCVPWPHYDDYIARDLVAHVDSNYRTIADSAHRGIAGLSMGGYGAVTLALRYPDVFGAAASHSGVLAPLFGGPKPFTPPAHYLRDMDSLRVANARLWPSLREPFGPDTVGWLARDPVTMAKRRIRADQPLPPIYVDVGVDDPWVDANRAFAHELTTFGAAVMYYEWPGKHDWPYWRGHVAQSLAWLGTHLTTLSPP